MSDLVASVLGDYRVEALLGQGVVGQVFRGAHVDLGTPVALKVIDQRYATSPGFKTRFVQYAQTMRPITHPNLLQVFRCGEQDGLSYIVMDLVTGGPLRPITTNEPWGQVYWTAVGLGKQAVDGLAAAHARGVSHGDIKLANLLLTRPDITHAQVKVADVGVLRLVGEEGRTASAMPQAAALDEPGRDLFAFGALIFELITGHSPFEGAREFPQGMPEELKAVIMRCLSTDAGGRFASCEELSHALGHLITAAQSAPQTHIAVVTHTPPAVVERKTTVTPTGGKRGTPPQPPPPLPPGGPMVPCVHVFDEAHTPVDMQFLRASGVTIGRGDDNAITLPAANVSTTHVRIDWDAKRVTVTDLGSANGTLLYGQRLLPQVAQEWGKDQWLQIGGYWLWLQRLIDGGPVLNKTEIMLDSGSKVMTITPGQRAVCRLTLINQKTQVDHLTLIVEGIEKNWVEGLDRVYQLKKLEKQEVTLPINVPRSPVGQAGDYTVKIHARSENDGSMASVDAHWSVARFEAMSVAIAPARATGLRQARYTLTLNNEGNYTTNYVLTGTDEEKQLECLFSDQDNVDRNRLQVKVEHGKKAPVKLKVGAARRWFGNPQAYPFSIQGAPMEGQQQLVTEAQFMHRALFPVWAMVVIPVVLLGILVAAPRFLKPTLRTVYIEPRSPQVGQKVDVYWDVSTATRIRIFVNDLPVLPDPDVLSGKYSFPEGFQKDTRVRVLASNLFGESPRDVTVGVVPPPPRAADPPPLVELLQASPQVVAKNQTVTLRWRVSGATRVDLAPVGTVQPSGTTSHMPLADTTYTLTAFNRDNVPTTSTVSVRVMEETDMKNPADLALSPSGRDLRKDSSGNLEVRVDRTVILRWAVRDAAKVRIDAITPLDLEGSSGQRTVQLKGEGTYTFTLVATNTQGREFRSQPVVINATCRGWTRIFGGDIKCNRTPQVQW